LKSIRPIFLIFLLIVFINGNVPAQTGSVFFDPDTTTVGVNDSCQIDIAVNSSLTGIHCYIVSIGFDSLLVELADVTEGPLLPDSGQTFFFWNENNGGYDIGSCLLGYGLFANGPGILATMKFRTFDSTGTSSLHFTAQEFTDTLNNPINVLPLYGAIVVEDTLSPVYDDSATGVPDRFGIFQIYPNPFNSQTSIEYWLDEPSHVEIGIYDLLGRRRDVLVSDSKPAGDHRIVWNAEEMESGIYFARIYFEGYSETKKMILIK
jgi:hypothetical protein